MHHDPVSTTRNITHTHTPVRVQVSVCPFDLLTGYTLFVEDEDRSVNALLTRADMEAHMVSERR